MRRKLHADRSRHAGIAERRVIKAYASLSAVPTGELEALAGLLRDCENTPGPNHAGLVGPVVMAELARRNQAAREGRSRPAR
ncbi:hypothetical protein Arth_3826 [Arthrobacter sp. FB24]|jgi:hypothetical protein|uniref:hypothetical protein n=1 Tax=Arthrobacter sp. (strain FB24) TaxID=290399 RepID=UPI0000527779|nr:hypothetical protein [Arthrobacter sp. FB24]ABK05201.1 hypothetical protein Arth_3826 [Arthrobacter sp. FB24]